MFDIVKRFVASTNAKTGACERADRIQVAACALLLEMAAIDGEFSPAEQDSILAILQQEFALGALEATAVMEAAQAERAGSIDLWRFTNLINQDYPTADKIRVIEMIWKVIYVDGRLQGHEDHLVHKLAKLLHLGHAELIEAKLRVKNPGGPFS